LAAITPAAAGFAAAAAGEFTGVEVLRWEAGVLRGALRVELGVGAAGLLAKGEWGVALGLRLGEKVGAPVAGDAGGAAGRAGELVTRPKVGEGWSSMSAMRCSKEVSAL